MDIKRYSVEINNILDSIDKLSEQKYYEKVKKPGIASARKIGDKIGEDFLDLLEKIKNESPGLQERINEGISKLDFSRDNY